METSKEGQGWTDRSSPQNSSIRKKEHFLYQVMFAQTHSPPPLLFLESLIRSTSDLVHIVGNRPGSGEEQDLENGVLIRQQSRAWCWCLSLGLALMLGGVVVGGAYLYRYYVLQKGQVFYCGVKYREEDFMIREEEVEAPLPSQLRQIQEKVRVLEDDEVELINVPVPEFTDSDPADIVHDFNRRLTAYLDLNLNKCYVIPLNTSIVMPPRDFLDLLINIKVNLGPRPGRQTATFPKLVVFSPGMQKREALNCHKIRHFENKFVVETQICEP
ncbi:integral membrane protein 2B-like [Scleropages formosus]|uniref:Integral membrane protein 2 n=1 Tax=Scleropages formosus TaxID=113540 RepID=A0A0P7V7F2_SCLFO|nr:integral membrane protein 2B-like [Scleropages formosus]